MSTYISFHNLLSDVYVCGLSRDDVPADFVQRTNCHDTELRNELKLDS